MEVLPLCVSFRQLCPPGDAIGTAGGWHPSEPASGPQNTWPLRVEVPISPWCLCRSPGQSGLGAQGLQRPICWASGTGYRCQRTRAWLTGRLLTASQSEIMREETAFGTMGISSNCQEQAQPRHRSLRAGGLCVLG